MEINKYPGITSTFKSMKTLKDLEEINNYYTSLHLQPEIQLSLINNGSTYLKVLEYYREEKERFKEKTFKFEDVERFIEKYFDSSASMKIKILEDLDSSLQLDVNYLTLPYVYMHKNFYLKNRYMFINDYKEVRGCNSKGEDEKIMFIIKAVNVLDYKNCNCFIHFECQLKFTDQLKIKQVYCKINDIEMLKLNSGNGDESEKSTNERISLNDLKISFFAIYKRFKAFMSELKKLILDLEYLSSI